MNDTLLVLYTLSSSTLTYWCLCLFLILVFIKIYRNISIKNTILYLLFLVYFIQLTCSFNVVAVLLNTQIVNITLQNGLLNIHPIYIYNTYIFAALIWLSNYKWYTINNIIQNMTTNMFSYLCIIISGVYLGSFWASQELNWGGFWSWDPVEMISLFLVFWFMLHFHNKNDKFLNKPINHLFIAVVTIYLIIRLGVVTTIHSFVRTNNNPFLTNLALLLLVVAACANTYKYYHLLFKNFFKISICIFSIIIWYLYVYIYHILICVNSFILDTTSGYFTITLFILYYVLVCNKQNITIKYSILLPLITTILLYVNNTYLYFILFGYVFFCNLFFFKNIKMHILLLCVYLLFYIYFVNIPVYNNKIKIYGNMSINNLTNSKLLDMFYELSFCLKKQLIMFKNKNMITNVSGFSIFGNNYVNNYIFSKNDSIYFVFILEIISMSVLYLLFLLVVGALNYKYTNTNNNNKKNINFY